MPRSAKSGTGVFCAMSLAAVLSGCDDRKASPPSAFRETRMQMGTFVRITVYAASRDGAKSAADAAFARIDEVSALMSSYVPDSELSGINRAAGKPVRVSPKTLSVIEEAITVGGLTNGALDITIGPLRRLWKAAGKSNILPTPAEIAEARRHVGYKKILTDPVANTVRLSDPSMEINLGGIAKGFAVDEAIVALRERGIRSALVDAGGDLYALGTRGDGKLWRVGVQNPRRPRDSSDFPSILAVQDVAVATSGNYQQFVTIEGRRYSHIIDPSTGRPVAKVPSATVIAPTCTRADALATATSVLDVSESLRIVDADPNVEAMLITTDGGRFSFHRSAGFSKYEIDESVSRTSY